MSAAYNPEAEVAAEIERLEIEARSIRRSVEHANQQGDRNVLNQQLKELEERIKYLRSRLPF